MPAPRHHRLCKIAGPNDLTSRCLKCLIAHHVPPAERTEQRRETREHGTGQDPRRHISRAPWNERQIQKLGRSCPTSLGHDVPNATPPEPWLDEQARGGLPCLRRSEWDCPRSSSWNQLNVWL